MTTKTKTPIRIEGNFFGRLTDRALNVKIFRHGREDVCVKAEANGRILFSFSMAEEDFCEFGQYLEATRR